MQREHFCELGIIIFCMEYVFSWLVFVVAKLRYAVLKRIEDRLRAILTGEAKMNDGVHGRNLPQTFTL